jgi:hypothetical protein
MQEETMLISVNIDELQNHLEVLSAEKAAMNRTNLNWFELRNLTKLSTRIRELEAVVWYNSNIGNVRGLLDRLPSNDERKSIWHLYNKYNILLRDLKLPSTYTMGLVPGLNARYSDSKGSCTDDDSDDSDGNVC